MSHHRSRELLTEVRDRVEVIVAEPCLTDLMKQKIAEIAAAKGDPKRFFGKELLSPSPDADAVDKPAARVVGKHQLDHCFLRAV